MPRKWQPRRPMTWLIQVLPRVSFGSGHVSPSCSITWPSLFLHVSDLHFDHVLWCLDCSTCRFVIGTHVRLLLVHMLHFHWTMLMFLIRLHGMIRIFHALVSYFTTCHVLNNPRIIFHLATWLHMFPPCLRFLLVHILCPDPSTCQIFIWPHGLCATIMTPFLIITAS